MRLMAKNYPFIHKLYTLCVRCVLRREFLQCTQRWNISTTVGRVWNTYSEGEDLNNVHI
jgi:hypothetical protein